MGQDGKVIYVVKRDGSKEELNLDKIHKILEFACDGITGVSVSDIEMKAHLSFYDGITTKEINTALIKSAADLISEVSPNYQYAAGKLLNYEMRKDAWGGKDAPRLFDHIISMVKEGFYTADLLEFYTEEEWDKLNEFIDHDRDLNMTYIGVNEYITKYAMRDRSLDRVHPLETPQITYILVAAILMHAEKSLKAVKSYYNDISLWNISLPTPIMAGIRSTEKQGSSCVLIAVDDNLNSIISGSGAIVKYIASKAGIGLDVSRIRAEGSTVKKDKSVKHTGVIPFLRLFESSVKSCSQGGVRGGSATCYYQLWHLEIEDLLVLKNNKGTQDNRVRKMDYGVQINNYLYNRFVQNKDITLFSPKDTPGLYDAFFSNQTEFARLYEKYEKDSSIRKKKVSARDLFASLVIERKETGRLYIFNVDNVNEHGAFKVPVTQSNLCLSGDTKVKCLLNSTPSTLTLEEINELFQEGKNIQVLSKNIDDGIVSYKKIENSALMNENAKVVRITDEETGKSIICTPEHQIYTKNRGYILAKDLMEDDLLDIS